VKCDYPPKVEFAFRNIAQATYPYNVTYICHSGYWIAPGQYSQDVTCTQEGVWKPEPSWIRCWGLENFWFGRTDFSL